MEDTRFEPVGRKAKVRAEIATMLEGEMRAGTIDTVICRAPEFYGPGKTKSLTNSVIFDRIKQGKRPLVPLNAHARRTLIWTPDASRGMGLIGNTPRRPRPDLAPADRSRPIDLRADDRGGLAAHRAGHPLHDSSVGCVQDRRPTHRSFAPSGPGGGSAGTSTDQPPCHHIHSYAYRSMNGTRYQARTHRGIARRFGIAPCSGSHCQPGRNPVGATQSPGERTLRNARARGGAVSRRGVRNVAAGVGTCRRPMPSHHLVSPVEIGLTARRSRRMSVAEQGAVGVERGLAAQVRVEHGGGRLDVAAADQIDEPCH